MADLAGSDKLPLAAAKTQSTLALFYLLFAGMAVIPKGLLGVVRWLGWGMTSERCGSVLLALSMLWKESPSVLGRALLLNRRRQLDTVRRAYAQGAGIGKRVALSP